MKAFEISDALAATHDAATPEQRAATRDDLKTAAAHLAQAARRVIAFSPVHGDDVLAARLLEVQDFVLKAAVLFDFDSAEEAKDSHVLDPLDMTAASAINCSAEV